MKLKLKNKELPLKLIKIKFNSKQYREGRVKRILNYLKEPEI